MSFGLLVPSQPVCRISDQRGTAQKLERYLRLPQAAGCTFAPLEARRGVISATSLAAESLGLADTIEAIVSARPRDSAARDVAEMTPRRASRGANVQPAAW